MRHVDGESGFDSIGSGRVREDKTGAHWEEWDGRAHCWDIAADDEEGWSTAKCWFVGRVATKVVSLEA